ncbi:MAG: hypothetical protein L0332_23430 [Chloroflexi bacterium]|nr:hypothetical protein [Chloroflexota bacterium]MCI0643554.1 hypothetical protein [Chloroflexota bacterium]MCI0729644.1 hypothetical protein [Chloroflexota bacterium]
MSLKNLERAVHRLEKKLPPRPNELFPFLDHLISQHPTLRAQHPTRPFSAALHAIQLANASLAGHAAGRLLFHDLLYDDAWSSIRQALDARWPRLRWALASHDPLYQAEGYHDCLDALACAVWQKSTDPGAFYFTWPTSEQELAIYHQYRQLPSPQRRHYRRQALEDASLYYDPHPALLQLFLDLLAEAKKTNTTDFLPTDPKVTF